MEAGGNRKVSHLLPRMQERDCQGREGGLVGDEESRCKGKRYIWRLI